jgi:hypothetical protein
MPILLSRDVAEEKPVDPGRLSALLLCRGSMESRWRPPKNTDPRTSHDCDERYIVATGGG